MKNTDLQDLRGKLKRVSSKGVFYIINLTGLGYLILHSSSKINCVVFLTWMHIIKGLFLISNCTILSPHWSETYILRRDKKTAQIQFRLKHRVKLEQFRETATLQSYCIKLPLNKSWRFCQIWALTRFFSNEQLYKNTCRHLHFL